MDDGVFFVMFLVTYVLVFIVPIAKVISRVGFSGWWSLLAVVPVAGIIGLWVFAVIRWPIDEPTR